MNFAAGVQSWLNSLAPPLRALVSAVAVVLIIGIIPQTRRYAIWAGLIVIALWTMAFYRQKGSA